MEGFSDGFYESEEQKWLSKVVANGGFSMKYPVGKQFGF